MQWHVIDFQKAKTKSMFNVINPNEVGGLYVVKSMFVRTGCLDAP